MPLSYLCPCLLQEQVANPLKGDKFKTGVGLTPFFRTQSQDISEAKSMVGFNQHQSLLGRFNVEWGIFCCWIYKLLYLLESVQLLCTYNSGF